MASTDKKKANTPENHYHYDVNVKNSEHGYLFFWYWFITTLISIPIVFNCNTKEEYMEKKGDEYSDTKYFVSNGIQCVCFGWIITPLEIGEYIWMKTECEKNNYKKQENEKDVKYE